jgi:hypothetical protein
MVSTNDYFFRPFKDLTFSKPKIAVQSNVDPNGFTIRLTSDRVARAVDLYGVSSGFFENNYFDLFPDRPVTVHFRNDEKISFDELLEVFWQTHDPTTLNRQGNDIGTQYRSGIFYHNQEQKEKAEKYKVELDKSGAFDRPIVTEITAFTKFYPAEDYHQQYFDNNEGSNPYCTIVIRPKVEKFKKVFKDKLKKHQ